MLLKRLTWALPDSAAKLKKTAKIIKDLEKVKKEAYDILGDDDFFDGIDNAVKRAKELFKLAAEKDNG